MGRFSEPLAERLAALVPLPAGCRVLDVGCGSGALTSRLAAAVGAENVTAVDLAPEFASACRARVPGADVRVAAATALPFPDGSFDAVFAQLLVHLVDDAPRTAAEMLRVARPGAPVVTCVWDFAEAMTPLRAFWDAARASNAPEAERHDQRGYPYATPSELESLWSSAGLRAVQTGELWISGAYAGFDDLWEPLALPDGTPGRFLATLDAATTAAIRTELARRVGSPDGSFSLSARAWYVLGYAGDAARGAT